MRRPLCCICMAFVVSVFCYLKLCTLTYQELPVEEGSQVTCLGEVSNKEYKDNKLILYLKQVQINIDSDKIPNYRNDSNNDIGILCYMDENDEPMLGSTVIIEGKISLFKEARNPAGFDQRSYYYTFGLDFQMKNVNLIKESNEHSAYHEKLYRIRRRMEKVLDEYMQEKDASIIKAMLLGNKTQIDKDSKQLYQRSGIAHILAISGLHISLIGMGIYNVLRKIKTPVIISSVISVMVMLVYGDMAGMSSSAYRAILMFAIKLGAVVLRRTYDMMTALSIAAVGILVEQPLYLYNAGFLLSFGAIIGISCILEAVKINKKQVLLNKTDKSVFHIILLFNEKIKNGILESLSASLSIFIIQFPVMLCFYYEFPVYSFLLNLVIIPAMGLVLALGIVCIIFGSLPLLMLGKGIAGIAALGCHALLGVFERLCDLSLDLYGSEWIVGRPDNYKIIVYYMMIMVMVMINNIFKYNSDKIGEKKAVIYKRIFGIVKYIWVVATVTFLTYRSYDGLGITFLDVGQGDGIWIETDTGNHYLIDGGSTSEKSLGKYTLIPYLKYTGTSKIEAVFLTHLDEDHISGVIELLESDEKINIGRIVIAKAAIRDEAYDKLVESCKIKNVPIIYAKTGDILQDGELKIEVMHPQSDYIATDRNGYSLVMKLEYGEFHAFFTGDVEADGEDTAVNELPANWHCDLYKAAHHGSNTSNTEESLDILKPKIAVISCGENNKYGHPHKETLELLSQVGASVLRTDEQGAIEIRVEEDDVTIINYRNQKVAPNN